MKNTKAKTMTPEAKNNMLALVRLEPPTTREAVLALCQAATRLTIERDAAQLKLDRRKLDLEEAHAPQIEAMSEEIERAVKVLHLWAIANRETEFEGRQGIDLAGCTLEFRKGTGKVVTAADEETTLNQLLALPESYKEEQMALVSVKCALNKRAVVSVAKTEAGAAFLKKMGIEIVVEEEFKFTPAREFLPPLTVAGGKAPVSAAA